MPSPLADDITAQIKQAISIVDLIGEQVALTRRGRTFKGLCPFHDDHNPSMDVDPERQRYRCWSCQAAGDIFDFVMNRDRVTFREALESLAQKARIALPTHRTHSSDTSKQDLFDILRWAEDEFHGAFLASTEARDYAAKRGLAAESIRAFRIGFAPNQWEWLVERARAKRFTPEMLERCGLVRRRQQGAGFYDWFRGRLMFPIRDARGRTIAFGGRILPSLEAPDQGKYTNSPETPIFSKAQHLYGLDQARDAIVKAKFSVVVEGYTDCIIAHQLGFTNVAGTLGTALGERHVRELKRYADRIVLVYDGDEAGQKATDRVLGLVLSQEVDLRILTLPGGLDPCDFLLKHGADQFRAGLDSAVDALDFKLRRAGQLFDLNSIHGRRQALDFVLTAIAALPASTTGAASANREIVLDRLGQRLGLPSDPVRRRLRELRTTQARRSQSAAGGSVPQDAAPAGSPWSNETWAERELLEVLFADLSQISKIVDHVTVEDIQTPGLRRMLEVIIELHRGGTVPDLDAVRLRLEDRELACRASILAETGQEKGAVEQRLADVLTHFRSRKAEAEATEIRRSWSEARGSEDAQRQLVMRQFNRKLTP